METMVVITFLSQTPGNPSGQGLLAMGQRPPLRSLAVKLDRGTAAPAVTAVPGSAAGQLPFQGRSGGQGFRTHDLRLSQQGPPGWVYFGFRKGLHPLILLSWSPPFSGLPLQILLPVPSLVLSLNVHVLSIRKRGLSPRPCVYR